jgi:tetratricopeptide (TPR) repeat protein
MRAVLLILTLIFLPLSLSAQPAPQPVSDGANKAAEGHHETGTRFFTEGRYDLARIEFEAAYALTKEPDLLYNIAICYEREGDLKQVIAYLERYLAAKPDDEKTKAKLQKMREQLAPTPASTPPSKAPSEVSRMSMKRKVGIALLSVGAASLLVALATGISTQGDRDALMSGELTYGQATTTAERARGTRGASIAFGVVGGAMVVAGVPLAILK